MDTIGNTTNITKESHDHIYRHTHHTSNTKSTITNINHKNNDNNNNKKQKRRRRMVKNEIVTIDDIDEEPGVNFINWIRITKEKLLVKF